MLSSFIILSFYLILHIWPIIDKIGYIIFANFILTNILLLLSK